jgi:hypothetical protein
VETLAVVCGMLGLDAADCGKLTAKNRIRGSMGSLIGAPLASLL